MQTRCPHCKTLFEIQQAQLRAASGQARCSCCDNIFNARKHLLQPEPAERVQRESKQPQNSGGAVSLSDLFEEADQAGTDVPEFAGSASSADAEGKETVTADVAATADLKSKKRTSDHEAPEPDNESSPLTDQRAFSASLGEQAHNPAAQAPVEPAAKRLPQQERQPIGLEREITGEHLIPDSLTLSGRNTSAGPRGQPLLWSVAILLLLATALAQIVWISRDDLQGYPEVRELLESFCAQTGCALPPWHEPERFVISSRSVKTHPKSSRALQIQLAFSNTARFPQPLPLLQLRLYDTNEKLSAQRVFRPDEYLSDAGINTALVMPGQSVAVEMALADPGADVTGFKIDFL